MSDERHAISIRPAQPIDADLIASCVAAAYQHYIERMGKPPGPMLEDYAQVIVQHEVWVAEDGRCIVGVLVLIQKEDGMLLDNIAVHPAHQGKGIGKRLMAFAESEAQQQGFAELNLYTHIKMTENIALYEKFGYVETERRAEHGFERVYMQKKLKG